MATPIREAAVFDNNSTHGSSTIETQDSRSSIAGQRTKPNEERHSATALVFAGMDISQMKMVKEEVIAKVDVVEQIAAMESANRKRRAPQPLSVVSYYAGKDISQMKMSKEEGYAEKSSIAAAPATLFELLEPVNAPTGKPFSMKAAALAATTRAAAAASTAAKRAESTASPLAAVHLKRTASLTKKQTAPTGCKSAVPVASPPSAHVISKDVPKERLPIASPPNAAGEFDCEVCDQSFKDKFARAHHMISQHRDNRNQQKKGSRGTQQKLNTAAYSRQFQCDVCPSRFSLNSSLLTHLRTEHSVPPYECKICSERFFYLAELTKHGAEEH